jgi:hypothetical protein
MWQDFPDDPARRRPRPQGEKPAAEPEIIPPDKPDGRSSRRASRVWVSVDDGRGHRFFFAKPSPWSIALGLLGLGVAVAVALVVLLGLFVLWLPVAGVLVAAFLVTSLLSGGTGRSLRRPPRR